MRIEGRTYQFIVASDIQRDGMGLECLRVDNGQESKRVLEAFWHDPTGRFTIRSFEDDLPYELVHVFLRKATGACPPNAADEPGTKTLIYVGLLDEALDVWRPTAAELQSDGVYRITGEQPDGERWRFVPGERVRCEKRRFQDGTVGVVAKERAG